MDEKIGIRCFNSKNEIVEFNKRNCINVVLQMNFYETNIKAI